MAMDTKFLMGLALAAWPEARRAAFHAHLDRCRRCAERPFDPCAEGHRLLSLTVEQHDSGDVDPFTAEYGLPHRVQ